MQHLLFEPAPRWFSAEAVEQADELTVAELRYGAEKSTSVGVRLVSNNTREFQRVPDLEVEDWTGA